MSSTGTINEKTFVKSCLQLPESTLEAALNFELLPSPMRQELHSRLPEVFIIVSIKASLILIISW